MRNATLNPNRWKIVQIVNIGTFLPTLDVGIVNVTFPTMSANSASRSRTSNEWRPSIC
ncbi:MAG TPA: hypothetical protein VEZ72_22460 [Paenibacillus sp.]|nr:hypothetical protein [Paenibacillus sp.]